MTDQPGLFPTPDAPAPPPAEPGVYRYRIYGEPVAQGRARAFVPKGWKRAVMYDPGNSRDWKRTVQGQLLATKPAAPLTGALELRLLFILQRPPSVSVKKRRHPIVKPDVKNLAAGVEDAMTGIIFVDDCQICSLIASKAYGENPGVEIQVRRME